MSSDTEILTLIFFSLPDREYFPVYVTLRNLNFPLGGFHAFSEKAPFLPITSGRKAAKEIFPYVGFMIILPRSSRFGRTHESPVPDTRFGVVRCSLKPSSRTEKRIRVMRKKPTHSAASSCVFRNHFPNTRFPFAVIIVEVYKPSFAVRISTEILLSVLSFFTDNNPFTFSFRLSGLFRSITNENLFIG